MKVLVTGATGFIGSHLVRRLLEEGHNVRTLARSGLAASSLEALGVEVVLGDLRDAGVVGQALKGREWVFHLAARSKSSRRAEKQLHAVNVEGTANIAQAAVDAGVDRFVFCSSCGIYGYAIKNRAINEETRPKPDSHYGRSKLLGEQIVLSRHKQDRLPVVVARISGVIGPGALRWLRLFKSIAVGDFKLVGDGGGYRHLADVSDVVNGLLKCAGVKDVEGRIYIIAGDKPLRLREFVQLIAEEVGGKVERRADSAARHLYGLLNRAVLASFGFNLPYAARLGFFLNDRIFDISRARKDLGYLPTMSPEQSIRLTADWFRAQGYLKK
jgi:nucleoside-diphosphate-sugar epimerase